MLGIELALPRAPLHVGNAQPWAYLSAGRDPSSLATERGQFAATVRAGQPKGCDFVSRLDMGRMHSWLVHEETGPKRE